MEENKIYLDEASVELVFGCWREVAGLAATGVATPHPAVTALEHALEEKRALRDFLTFYFLLITLKIQDICSFPGVWFLAMMTN